MILVTGATGANGTELTRLLAARGVPFRAAVRSERDRAALAALPGADVVLADFDDPASIDRALAGVSRAFLLTPSSERAEAQQLAFVEAARRAGVAHVVKLSQYAADDGSPVRFLRYHAVVERALEASGLAYTFLRPNLFMQGLLSFRESIQRDGQMFAPIGDAAVSVVDIRDIAAAAAAALTGSGHEGRTYTLTGPEALTHADMAAELARALGRPVAFVDVPPEAMRAAMLGLGMNPWQADGLIEDYAHYARGEAAAVSTGVADAAGIAPRPFRAFAHDYAGAFA